MQTTNLRYGLSANGYCAYAPSQSTVQYSATLPYNTDAYVTTPVDSSTYIVSFSYQSGSDVWVAINNSSSTPASLPAGSTLASTNSTLNPAQLTVNRGNYIHLITSNSGGAEVGVVFYVGI